MLSSSFFALKKRGRVEIGNHPQTQIHAKSFHHVIVDRIAPNLLTANQHGLNPNLKRLLGAWAEVQ